MTFRLRKAPENGHSVQEIPLWPCKLMQYLAKYVFKTGTRFQTGHHIPFGHVLPSLYSSDDETLIHDLLITNDRQLKSFRTNLGSVEFLQVHFSFTIKISSSFEKCFSLLVVLRMNWKQHRNVMSVKSLIYSVLIESNIHEK